MGFNHVGDRVYVRDAAFAWLPAVILEVENDRVRVLIDLPHNWNETTTTTTENLSSLRGFHDGSDKWVWMREYFSHRLPLRGNRVCRDMAELDHLHEAEILYQIKHRHCVEGKPYTRVVGDIIVAVNPCRWIPELYSDEIQKNYMDNFGNAYVQYGT